MNDLVLSQRKDGIAILTLNRPERLNAINDALVQALRRALAAALADAECSVILLTGAGRAFCSGDDLEDFPAQSRNEDIARRYLEDLQDVTRLMIMGEKMVVGAVHGWAVGGASNGAFIIHTSNGGATWTSQTVPATVVSVVSVSFVDSSHGWAAGFDAGNPGAVLATSASLAPITASPPVQVKSGICKPIFMNASAGSTAMSRCIVYYGMK